MEDEPTVLRRGRAMFTEEKDFNKRVRQAITISWEILQQKIASGFLEINKEASLQLQFANIFQSFIPMILFNEKEKVSLILEKTLRLEDGKPFECDVYIVANNGTSDYRFAIEMKCYRTLASSGKPRGAIDIFLKDVYEDIELLENYIKSNQCEETVFLAMTDFKNIVRPEVEKTAKYWDYDISDGYNLVGPKTLTTPIGGKDVLITIEGTYKFSWKQQNQFFFLEI